MWGELITYVAWEGAGILSAGKIHMLSESWLSFLKGYCDWIWPECVLDVCGKPRQKGAQMEQRKRTDQTNKQMQLLKADIMMNPIYNQCL